MPSLDELKNKYQPVMQQIQTQGVQLNNLHLQDGKLFIKGIAPSLEAANKVWDAIKKINPRLDDIIAEFPVDPSKAAAPSRPKQTQAQPQTARHQMYTVKPGDTLSKISNQFYGNPNDYMKIFNANKDKLKDPNQIQAGQELRIPAA